jgi:hypothetical protein
MSIALHHSRAKGAAKLVLLGIANHDGDGGAWPSIKTLAKYAAVTDRQVQKILKDLEELGEIRRHLNEGGDRRTSEYERPNLYEFLLACPEDCKGDKNHTSLDGTPRNKGGRPRKAVDKSPETPVSSTTPPVLGDTPPGVVQDTPPGVAQDTRTIHGNHPLNQAAHLGGSTSPALPVDNPPSRPLPRADRCLEHQDIAIPPPCGRCKDARLTLELVEEEIHRLPPRICKVHGLTITDLEPCAYCPGGRLSHLEGA